jgi:hypothetical protein
MPKDKTRFLTMELAEYVHRNIGVVTEKHKIARAKCLEIVGKKSILIIFRFIIFKVSVMLERTRDSDCCLFGVVLISGWSTAGLVSKVS